MYVNKESCILFHYNALSMGEYYTTMVRNDVWHAIIDIHNSVQVIYEAILH